MSESDSEEPKFNAIRHFMTHEVPFNRFLGLAITHLDTGQATMTIPYRDDLLGDASRPALHGGVISSLIDVVGGTALLTCVNKGDRLSTLDLRVDYLRPAGKDDLIAEATVLRVGSRAGVVKVRVVSGADEKHVAEGTGVYQIKRQA